MNIDLNKCTEIVPGVFKKTEKTFYLRDIHTGIMSPCNKVKIDKLIEKYGSIEAVGAKFVSKKTSSSKKNKRVFLKKGILRPSVKSIEATLINEHGKKVAIFHSSPANQEGNKIIYTFNDAKFNQEFIFVIQLKEKLFHPLDKDLKEIKVKFFNGQIEYTCDAMYDKESDYYCIVDPYATIQLLSIQIDH